MMGEIAIELPKLNNLRPTLWSTVLKLVEEAGELARAVSRLTVPAGGGQLAAVTAELLDVAQTCVSMIFVLEEQDGVDVAALFAGHCRKLRDKGYLAGPPGSCGVFAAGQGKCLKFPRLTIDGVSLASTALKIQEEMGELSQYLGKASGASGEQPLLAGREAKMGAAMELLDVAQCCATMMYILSERFEVDVGQAIVAHHAKLKAKGYWQ